MELKMGIVNARDANDPTITRTEYDEMLTVSQLSRDLYQGSNVIKGKKTTYLPKHIGEEDDSYELRLNRTVLYNNYQKFIDKTALLPFRHGLTFSEGYNEIVKSYTKNIDLLGTPLEVWAIKFYTDALINGLSHFLVENPLISPNRTLYDDITSSDIIRPYFVHIPATSLYGWNYEINNSKLELTQIRFVRQAARRVGLYGSSIVKEYVVYEPDVIRVFEKDNNKAILINEVPNSLGYIPLHTLNINQLDYMVANSPYNELANLNLRHYQSYSDQINIVHHTRMPILFSKNLVLEGEGSEGRIPIQPNVLLNGLEGSDIKYVEHSGSAIKTGFEDLQDIETKMSHVTGEYYTMKGVNSITATSHIINKIESSVSPGARIRMLEAIINAGLNSFVNYDPSLANTGELQLNTEDSVVPETVNFQYITNMYQQGVISSADYINEAKRRSILDESVKLYEGPAPEPTQNLNRT
jgi:hypothetical protein